MKKIFTFAFILSFLFCKDALAISPASAVAISNSASALSLLSSDESQEILSNINKIYGKKIQGCRIVSAVFDFQNARVKIFCIKNRDFYYASVKPEYIECEKDNYKCDTVIRKDLAKLLEDEQD